MRQALRLWQPAVARLDNKIHAGPNSERTGEYERDGDAEVRVGVAVLGTWQVSNATAVGTLSAYKEQLMLSLACVLTNKATAVNVYWALNGTSLGNI